MYLLLYHFLDQQTSSRAADLSAVKTLTINTKLAGQQITSPVAGLHVAVRTQIAVTKPASQQVSSSKDSLSAVKL